MWTPFQLPSSAKGRRRSQHRKTQTRWMGRIGTQVSTCSIICVYRATKQRILALGTHSAVVKPMHKYKLSQGRAERTCEKVTPSHKRPHALLSQYLHYCNVIVASHCVQHHYEVAPNKQSNLLNSVNRIPRTINS